MSATRSFTPPKFNDITGAIRMLAVDAVQKANSGHPGAPMGMAEIADVLWNRHLRHNPTNPKWPDRDRFILSNGHGSMLIYALLHLSGYDLPMEELKRFRQLHSKTPGHPEYGYTPGVETTGGPLGQGITNAVGMAMAEKLLAAEFNKPGHEIVNHHTYVFMGDGCMMEGISHEACALAGTWGLGKLMAFWDDNNVSIDGHVDGWFTDDTPKRFEAYGWHVVSVNGHDPEAVDAAINAGKKVTDKPTLICCRTIIGMGSPNKADTHDVHGAALGDAEVAATREYIGWKYPPFEIPKHVYEAWDARTKGAGLEKLWNNKFAEYKAAFPKEAAEFERRIKGDLPANWKAHAADVLVKTNEKAETIATRKASQNAINALAPVLPEFLGGSADLTGSNLTNWDRLQASAWQGHRQLHQLRCARVWHVTYHERHGPAWRLPAVRRHLFDVLRICAQCVAYVGIDEAARDLRVHPRFHRSGRRRPDASGSRADRHAALYPEYGSMASVRHG